MTVEPGQEAPDFELKDQAGELVSLAGFRGDKAVTLVFYPFTFTGVCQGELCELRDDLVVRGPQACRSSQSLRQPVRAEEVG